MCDSHSFCSPLISYCDTKIAVQAPHWEGVGADHLKAVTQESFTSVMVKWAQKNDEKGSEKTFMYLVLEGKEAGLKCQ